MTEELPCDQRVPGKLVALDQMDQEILTQLLVVEVHTNDERQGNLLQINETKISKTTRRPEVTQMLLRSKVVIWSKLDTSSMLFRHRMERKITLYAENTC